MEIYLMRHGEAGSAAGLADSERALTPRGKDDVRRVLRRAGAAGATPSLILASPYRRARETAEIAAETLGYRGRIVTSRALLPNATPAEAWDEIRSRAGERAILAASHQPLMSALLAYLLGAPSLEADFQPGAMACVEAAALGAAPRCALRWLLTPAVA